MNSDSRLGFDLGLKVMRDFYQEKKAHNLYCSADAEHFLSKFHAHTGKTISSFLNEFINTELIDAVSLTGSIPYGIGSAVSDIDFVLLVNDRDFFVREKSQLEKKGLTFSYEEDGLVLGGFVSICEGLEIDITIVPTKSYSIIYERLTQGNTFLNGDELTLLSRIETGWLLHGDQSLL